MKNTNKSFSLNLIGFTESQKRAFLAILSLAERWLKNTWETAEITKADFFIFSTDKLHSESLVSEKKLPIERCLFYSEQFTCANNEISTDVEKIPRLASLIETLNWISNLPQFSVKNTDAFDPEQTFLKHLLAPCAELFVCHFLDYDLYVDTINKRYYCPDNLQNLLTNQLVTLVNIDSIESTAWHETIQQINLKPQSLDNLIWYLSFKLSNGFLLQGHSAQDSVYLTRWPDLGLQDCSRYVKLAAFMRNNAGNLLIAAERTATPLPEVYSFYNACYLMGIVEKTEQSELRTKVLDAEKQTLLAKITQRLQKIDE